MKKIESIDQFKTLAFDAPIECFVRMGAARSSKNVQYLGNDQWEIYNGIDDFDQNLTTIELWTESNIGKALDLKQLYLYD